MVFRAGGAGFRGGGPGAGEGTHMDRLGFRVSLLKGDLQKSLRLGEDVVVGEQ